MQSPSLTARVNELATPERLVRFGGAIALALAIGFALHVLTTDGVTSATGGRMGGDWAPFRTAGELAARDPALVLDVDAQREAMSRYFDGGGFLTFAYPPVIAFLFIPGSWASFTTGYVLAVVVLAVVAVAATRLTMDVVGITDPTWRRVGHLGALTFAPVFRAYTGAQNSTVTWLILAGGFWLLQRERPWLAGSVLGLLWYKPQFVVPVVGLVLVLRFWRVAAAAVGVGVAFWGLNAAVYGPGWVGPWLAGPVDMVDRGNIGFSTDITVTVVEWVRWVVGGTTGMLWALLVAVLLGLVFVGIGWTRRDPEVLLPLTSAALLVTAPHALVYEMTLLVPVIASGLALAHQRGVPAVAGWWALSVVAVAVQHPAVRIGFVVAVVAWWYVQVQRGDGRERTRMNLDIALGSSLS